MAKASRFDASLIKAYANRQKGIDGALPTNLIPDRAQYPGTPARRSPAPISRTCLRGVSHMVHQTAPAAVMSAIDEAAAAGREPQRGEVLPRAA